ncbi:hypothetical protein BJX64DRAFT_25774 [Aspergillus heterothallicus]
MSHFAISKLLCWACVVALYFAAIGDGILSPVHGSVAFVKSFYMIATLEKTKCKRHLHPLSPYISPSNHQKKKEKRKNAMVS